jgi:hypothetical protein
MGEDLPSTRAKIKTMALVFTKVGPDKIRTCTCGSGRASSDRSELIRHATYTTSPPNWGVLLYT